MSDRSNSSFDDDLDPLLRRLALSDAETGRSREPGEDPAADRLLDAYRQGRLSAEEQRQLEARLRREPDLRRRLARSSGLEAELPAGVRERVLAGYRSARRWGAWRPWLAAAAAAMVVGALGLVLLRSPGALPPEVAYSVEVRGLAEVRDVPSSQDPEASTADVPPEVAAYAGTMVRIVARPERSLALRLEPALYRLSEEGPEPVEPDRWELERRDGVFTLSGEAGALTGGTAGLHTLYLVLVRPGDLPEELGAWEASNLQERLAADGRRRVYPVILELLPEPADETIPFPGETP